MVEPKALLYHRVSATLNISHNRSEKRYLSERNTFRTLLKNYSIISIIILFPAYILLLISESLFFFVLGKRSIAKSNLRAFIWNIKNYKSTLEKRAYVQKNRKVSDFHVIIKMKLFPNKLIIFYDFVKNWNTKKWKMYF
jgi:hypothetical protein